MPYLFSTKTSIHRNLFAPNASFLYPLKTSENLTVFLCFQGVEKGCIGNECVKKPAYANISQSTERSYLDNK